MNDEDRKVGNKIVEYKLQIHAKIGSGFDTWIISKNLPRDCRTVDLIKNGKGIISLFEFNGYI